jgi:hypothetical protein
MAALRWLRPPPTGVADARVAPALGRLREGLVRACPGCDAQIQLPPARLGAAAVLGHRQRLERESPAAFAGEAMLERVLREVAESYDEKQYGDRGNAVMTFPGVVALSHCWLALDHPDPEARNLREKWLPAVEWYFSERVKRACEAREGPKYRGDSSVSEARRAAWAGVSDAELLERCDFGIFIECARAARTRAAAPRPDATRPRSSRGLAA